MKHLKDIGLLFTRLVLVFIFLWHGIPKAFNPSMAMGKFAGMGFPGFLGPIVGWVEVVAAVLILIGLWHKWATLALGIIIVVAILGVQLKNGVTAGLERDLLILAATITLMGFGPGTFALSRGS
jgi:putative oxidoreductase